MNRVRMWLIRACIALAALALPAVAIAGGCGSPPDGSGDWVYVDDLALNMRLMSSSTIAYGTYDTVDRRSNYESSTLRNVTLGWSGYKTTTWSASLRNLGGKTNTRERETIRVTVDIPPFYEALLQIRDASRYDFYRFDAGCLWFNSRTHVYQTAVAQHDVEGNALRRWHAASVSMRTVW